MAVGTMTEFFTRTIRISPTIAGAVSIAMFAGSSGGYSGFSALSIVGSDQSGVGAAAGDVLVRAGSGQSGGAAT
jgi:hypothetical protein